MTKTIFVSFLLAVSLAACGGGAGSALPSTGTVSTTPPTTTAPQASGRIAFSDPTFSAPSFDSTTENESGSCASAIQFTSAQSDLTTEWAQLAISEQGYSGAFTVGESLLPVTQAPENASVTTPSQVVTSTLSATTLTLAAIAAGGVNVTVSDSLGHSASCTVGVTTTTATVSSRGRRP